jgi:hypothetical protein
MTRPVRFVRLELLVCLGLTGCMSRTGSMAEVGQAPRPAATTAQAGKPADRTLVGSVQEVAMQTQDALADLNLLAEVRREADGVWFDCRTSANTRFILIVRPAPPQDGRPCTRIHVGWERDKVPEDGLADPVVGELLDRIEKLQTACRSQRRPTPTSLIDLLIQRSPPMPMRPQPGAEGRGMPAAE